MHKHKRIGHELSRQNNVLYITSKPIFKSLLFNLKLITVPKITLKKKKKNQNDYP